MPQLFSYIVALMGERWASVAQFEYLLEGPEFHVGASAAFNVLFPCNHLVIR